MLCVVSDFDRIADEPYSAERDAIAFCGRCDRFCTMELDLAPVR
jgi:hypothetical protein